MPDDSPAQEAPQIVERALADLRSESCEALVANYLDRTVRRRLVGATGSVYDVEVETFWEEPRQPGTLLVRVIVDWPHRGSQRPAIGDFLIGSDGNVVSEREWFRDLDRERRPVWLILGTAGISAAAAWIIWAHRNPAATAHVLSGLATAVLFTTAVLFRRWRVRRRIAGGSAGHKTPIR